MLSLSIIAIAKTTAHSPAEQPEQADLMYPSISFRLDDDPSMPQPWQLLQPAERIALTPPAPGGNGAGGEGPGEGPGDPQLWQLKHVLQQYPFIHDFPHLPYSFC